MPIIHDKLLIPERSNPEKTGIPNKFTSDWSASDLISGNVYAYLMSYWEDLDDQLRWLELCDLNLEYMDISHLDCVSRVVVLKIFSWIVISLESVNDFHKSRKFMSRSDIFFSWNVKRRFWSSWIVKGSFFFSWNVILTSPLPPSVLRFVISVFVLLFFVSCFFNKTCHF